MNVDPRHLRMVLAVAEHGSFNRAAGALGISQPALSKAMMQLERAIGTRLFDRGKQGAELTAAGHIVLRGAHNVEQAIRQAQNEVQAERRGLVGPLAIGATPSMLPGIVANALGGLLHDYPDGKIAVREGLDDTLIPALKRGEIEMMVGPLDASHTPDAEFHEQAMIRETFFVGVPRDHHLSGAKTLAIADIIDERWILPTPGSSFYRVVDALFVSAGTGLPERAIVTSSLLLIEQLVVATGRLSILTPAQFAGREMPFDMVPITNAPIRDIGVRYLAGRQLSPLAEALIPQLKRAAVELRLEV